LDKQKPGTIPFGTAGIGSNGHMLVALLSARTSMQLVHVPYKGGGPAIIDVVGGQIPLVGTGVVSAIQQVRNGSVKAIGVGSANRDPALPNVPTFAESGLPGFLCLGWTGIVAPTGTPRAIIDRLQREIGAALGEKEVRDRYATMGIAAHGTTSEEFAELIRTDLVKWGNVIREAGIKAE
ncbi:MAG: Bug family tripartite tricarboxylate transporter substrate binding protein, partial [Burkholderiales bacterium]